MNRLLAEFSFPAPCLLIWGLRTSVQQPASTPRMSRKYREKGWNLAVRKGAYIQPWCSAQEVRSYHHGWGVLFGGWRGLVPDLLELRLWEDENLSLSHWTLYSYLLFFLHENTRNPWLVFANTRLDSLSLEKVVVAVAFSSLRKVLLPWHTVYFPPWQTLKRHIHSSFL